MELVWCVVFRGIAIAIQFIQEARAGICLIERPLPDDSDGYFFEP